jgi:subtilisin family serine protease
MRVRLSRFLLLLITLASPALAADHEAVILRTTGSRDALRQAVVAVGGTVSAELQNVNAIAATVPTGTLAALGALPDVKLEKDELVAPPSPRDPTGLGSGAVELGAADAVLPSALSGGQVVPNDYLFNNKLIRANLVQATGNQGQGVIVAIIDSGTANNAAKVGSIAGSVIGGQSFVPAAVDPVASATSTQNGPHGTWVGSVIAGHAAFGFLTTGSFAQAVRAHAPDSFIEGSVYGRPDLTVIPLVGVAPAAKLYALKVFRSSGGSSPNSWILAAIDRALTLKKNFLAGVPSVPVSGAGTEDDPYLYDSLDIGVVNLSLGGGTLVAGRDLEDQLVQQLLDAGITVAVSAGNAGPAGLTTGSPSTSLASISSAAATTPAHERIYWSIYYGDPAVGSLFRPSDAVQTALFSSRGPTADGRVGVSVITAGDFNFAQAASGVFNFVSGTSFAAPTVAGAAALLRAGVPKATATQVRNAIIGSANPRLLGDNSSRFDQGAGFLDVEAALKLLKGGRVSKSIQTNTFTDDVAENLARVGLRTRELSPGGSYRHETGPLLPGERDEYYLKLDDQVGGLRLDVLGVTPELPADQQNQLFGDDVIVQVQNAKTSSADVRSFSFAKGAESTTLTDLDTGVVRLTFLGDWTNAGRSGASFRVTALPKAGKKVFDTQGRIADGEWTAIPVTIPPGSATARFELSWKDDWGAYPTNDLDLVVIDPAGNENWDGATWNSPERATLVNPAPGEYWVLVNGYTVFGPLVGDHETGRRADKTDRYKLRVFVE